MIFDNSTELQEFFLAKYSEEEIAEKMASSEYMIYEFEGKAERRKLQLKRELKVSLS